MRIFIIIVVSVALFGIVHQPQITQAQESTKTKPVQKPPKVKPGNVPQPEITITENKDKVIKEYHINGELRAIKVIPKNGFPAYYLVDKDGSGNFVKLGPDIGPEHKVPQWVFFEW